MSSDTYYGYEDEIETTEHRLATLDATSSALGASNQAARETMDSIRTVGQELWEKAVAENDQPTLDRLNRLGEYAKQLNLNRDMTAEALAGTMELARQFMAELDITTSQFEELQEAIYDDDRSNVFVSELALSIEADIKDIAADEAYAKAITNARSEVWQEVSTALKSACPRATWGAIHRCVAALEEQTGNEQRGSLNKQQLGLLQAFLATFEQQAAAS